MQFRALDLCCKAGGVSRGLVEVGFDVTGVDKDPQPHYPYAFIQADALLLDLPFLRSFHFIWASWPCQHGSRTRPIWKNSPHQKKHPNLIPAGRKLLQATERFWIMENVAGAGLENTIMLCGTMFGLPIIRHRRFESNLLLLQPPHPRHVGRATQLGRPKQDGDAYMTVAGHFSDVERARAAMEIDWMVRDELAQAIPPAYSRFLGQQVMTALRYQTKAA